MPLLSPWEREKLDGTIPIDQRAHDAAGKILETQRDSEDPAVSAAGETASSNPQAERPPEPIQPADQPSDL